MRTLTTKKQPAPSKDAMLGAGNQIHRLLAGYPDPPRVRWDNLDEDQQAELVRLTQMGDVPGGGSYNLAQLDRKDLKRWEMLVEVGIGRPQFFDNARAESELHAELAAIVQEASRPPRRVRYEREGSLRLPPEIFVGLDRSDPAFSITTLGLLSFLLIQLENGKALVPGGTIEGVGDDAVLVIDDRLGLGGRYGEVPGWRNRLDHLGRFGWLDVSRQGRTIRVSRGARALKALKAA